MTKQEFQQRIAEGPLILDGATGSNLLKAGMPRGICSEKWIAEVMGIMRGPDVLICVIEVSFLL